MAGDRATMGGGGSRHRLVSDLVTVDWLASHRARIVDTRWYIDDHALGRRQYDAAHIPGAVFLDLEQDLSAADGPGRHPLPDRDDFAATLGAAGVGNDDRVVAYDHGPGIIAARLWWMMRWIGHGKVSVLDGGIEAWRQDDRPTTAEATTVESTSFTPGEALTRTIDRQALRASLGSVPIVDARAAERYTGDVETVDAAAGHIPTSVSAPTTGNLVDGRFASAEALADRFTALGLDPDQATVTSCGSGVTACHNALALRLAGHVEAVLYPGSWSDWSAAGYPVVTGADPGSA